MRTKQLEMGLAIAVAAMAAGLVAANGIAAQSAGGAQSAPVAAESLERTFTFIGNDLRITVSGSGAGTLRVVRGELGRIAVTARSYGGMPVAALGSNMRGELLLDSGPAARADYVVVIPAEMRLSVRLAGHPGATLSPLDGSGGWSWPAHSTEPLPQLPQ